MGRRWTRHSNLIPILMFLIIGSGLVPIWIRLRSVETEMLDLRTRTTTEQVAFRFENFIAMRLHLVQYLTIQWSRNQINTPDRFREASQALQEEFRTYQAINWVDPAYIIRWVVPEADNLPAKNRDLRTHLGLAEILQDVRERNVPRASPPLQLFQGGCGFGTYYPLMRDGRCEGFINGVFRMKPLVADCLHRGVLGDFHLQITDAGATLFAEASPEVFDRSPHARSYPIRVLDRHWTVTLVPTAVLISSYETPADEMFLIVGLLLAAGLAVTLKAFLRRQNAIQESEQRLRTAVENMPVMVAAFNPGGQVIAWNRYCEQITGYTAAEIVGNPKAEFLLQPKRGGGVAIDSRPFGLARGPAQEWLISRKDGSVRTILWTKASTGPAVPGWAAWGVGADITERRQTEDSLRLTQFAIDYAAVATFWIGKDARFFYVNRAACEALGYTYGELLQRSVFDVDPNIPSETWPDRWLAIKARTEPVTFETVLLRKNGTTFPVEVTASSLCYKGEFYDFIFAKDLTDRKQAEAERLAMERALLETQRLESLGLLAGGVAHDFNNLLTAMMGTLSLARKTVPKGSTLAGYLEHVEFAGQQASDLARQLLAYSGGGKFVLTDVDLRSVIEDTGNLLRASIPKSVAVEYCLGDVPICIKADVAQMRQIVMNLLINAAEAIGEKDGMISVRTANVLADREMLAGMTSEPEMIEGPYAMLEVADTGCGIDAEQRARIFEPFFSTKSTGRGLGLAAVLGIVRGHRGTIRVESEPGRGAVFQVLLPGCDSPAASRQEQDAPKPSSVGGTILVVDDEQAVRTVAQIILEDSGFSVLLAHDGKEGVEVFRQHAEEIQAVLLDMTMPYMDGRAVLSAIRGICPDARVLLSSGYGEQQTVGDLTWDRITQFIQKPYRADQLLAKLQQILVS